MGHKLNFILFFIEIVEKTRCLFATYSSPFRLWMGHKFFIILHDPEHFSQILNSPDATDKGDVRKIINRVMGGEGLFTSRGGEWKRHRKLLNPTIQHFKVLNSFYPIFNVHMAELVRKLESRIDAEEFNIYRLMEQCSLNMICGACVKQQMWLYITIKIYIYSVIGHLQILLLERKLVQETKAMRISWKLLMCMLENYFESI